MQEVKNDISIDQSVIKTLLYYDIFNYPLKGSEVYRFLNVRSITEATVIDSLNSLVDQQLVFRFEEFYSVQPHQSNIDRRIKGNKEADRIISIAKQKAFFISSFPFVRAVMASGSLSKGYMDEKSDLDFFVVTEPGKLWIARMLLVMYKRIFLLNSHKFFCVNYFVDYSHLEIEDKNLFTATELATVIPLYGSEYYEQLQRANSWIKKVFPNFKLRSQQGVPLNKSSRLKRALEKVISFFAGNWLDHFFMNMTLSRWRRKYQKKYNKEDFDIALKTKKHVSKNHPQNYQRRVIQMYEEKLTEFSKRFNMTWHD